MTTEIPLPDWRKCLRPGMRIHLASGAACPYALVDSLMAAAAQIGDLELVQGLTLPPTPWADPAVAQHLKINAFYLDNAVGAMVNAGLADYTPAHYSDIPALYRDGTIRIDAALIMVSPPDAYGYCSLGPSVEWTPAAIDCAKLVIAEFNPRMPRTNGLSHIHVSKFDYAITHEQPLRERAAPAIDDIHRRIGEYAAQLVRDGDTLQFGVGPAGFSLAKALAHHRNLGIHCEVISDPVRELFEAGVVDNSRKTLLQGKCVTAQAIGSAKLYSFIDTNPHFEFRSTEFTNDPVTIARNHNMVSVNSALLCDLSGQVVVDSLQGSFRSGIASIVDFVRGASMSPGGRAIIALPSTGKDDRGRAFSRIVASLPAGAGVGCTRTDVYYLITEYGIATLRGRTIQERVQEMIQVAHPDFREDLLREARQHHLLPAYFQLPPPAVLAESGVDVRKLELRDGRNYILRPLSPADDRRLQEFFYSHNEETIIRRYGFTITRMSRERAFELVGVNQNRDIALAVVEVQGPRQVIHAVGRYYLDADETGAEMAFVVAENKRRLGMARVLLQRMLEVATARKLKRLWAQVDRDNAPMLGLFREYGATESPSDDPHTIQVEIPLDGVHVPSKSRSDFLKFTRSATSNR